MPWLAFRINRFTWRLGWAARARTGKSLGEATTFRMTHLTAKRILRSTSTRISDKRRPPTSSSSCDHYSGKIRPQGTLYVKAGKMHHKVHQDHDKGMIGSTSQRVEGRRAARRMMWAQIDSAHSCEITSMSTSMSSSIWTRRPGRVLLDGVRRRTDEGTHRATNEVRVVLWLNCSASRLHDWNSMWKIIGNRTEALWFSGKLKGKARPVIDLILQ